MSKVKLKDGTTIYCLDKVSAKHTVMEIFEEEIYSHFKIEEGLTIFDVGANIGLFTLFVSQKTRNSSIYAFEPVPDIFKVLKKNISNFSSNNTYHPFNIGLGSKKENQEITFYPNISTISTFLPNNPKTEFSNILIKWDEYTKDISSLSKYVPVFLRSPILKLVYPYFYSTKKRWVEINTLSNLIRNDNISEIDILKIDAENFELQILKGIDPPHWKLIKSIMLEIHGNVENGKLIMSEVVKLLESNNFNIKIRKDESMNSIGLEMIYARNRNYD